MQYGRALYVGTGRPFGSAKRMQHEYKRKTSYRDNSLLRLELNPSHTNHQAPC